MESMISETLEIIEAIHDVLLNNYDCLKQRIEQLVSLTELGQRDMFRNLQHKSTQTYLTFQLKFRCGLRAS